MNLKFESIEHMKSIDLPIKYLQETISYITNTYELTCKWDINAGRDVLLETLQDLHINTSNDIINDILNKCVSIAKSNWKSESILIQSKIA
jgi:hypothetical protein